MNKFSVNLRELREERSLTQAQLGKEICCTQTGIAKWEGGTREPNIENILLLAKFFNVTTDYLLGATNNL